jgi:hypothetical protein
VPRDLDPIDTGAFVDLGYPLPADTLRVLRVDVTDDWGGYLADRRLLRHWTVRTVAGTKLLEIPRYEVFQTVQVTIAANPGPLVDEPTTSPRPPACPSRAPTSSSTAPWRSW